MTISSFSPVSFSPNTFTLASGVIYSYTNASFTNSFTIPPIVGTGGGKKNKFRNWIARLAKGLKDFFRIKQREEQPEPEDVPIPEAQPPKIFHILPSPPTMETKLETVNDKWLMPRIDKPPVSVVASTPAVESPPPDIYPMILNPHTSTLVQTKVTLPKTNKSTTLPPYRVAEGSHIESQLFTMKKPKDRAKAASTINTLMILLEIESKI